MSDINSYDLLYLLEKVRAASKERYSVFHSNVNKADEHRMLLKLEEDGLIRDVTPDGEVDGHMMWRAS